LPRSATNNSTTIDSSSVEPQPGWITFSRDGRFADPSTGEIIDTKGRKTVAA
jgi:hypothetical protein